MNDVNVAVVGGGPVALSTALGLAQNGVSVVMLNTVEGQGALSPVMHDWSVLPGLDGLGILGDAVRAGFTDPVWGLRVPSTGEHIDLDLRALKQQTPFPFNLHIEPTTLRTLFLDRISRVEGARVERACTVAELSQDAAGVTLAFDSAEGARELRADWVVGADGTKSAVRQALGVGYPGFTWDERSVVALVDADLDHAGYRSFTLQVDDRVGAVLQKIGPGRWIHIHAESRALPIDTIGERLPAIIRDSVGGLPVRVLGWRAERMHQRTADRYRVGRVLLAGESAHVANRMIGHSPIAGFFDAYRITEALTAVVHTGTDDAVLDAYAAGRRQVFLDHASPVSSSRKLLVGKIGDRDRVDIELEHYRRAAADPEQLRELLLFNNELAGESPILAAERLRG